MYRLFVKKLLQTRNSSNYNNNSKVIAITRFSSQPSNKLEDIKKPLTDNEPVNINISRRSHNPTNFERKILVWTGRYKTIEDIPSTVTVECIEKARNKARIKIANYMILLTLIGCLTMAISGRRAAERGESVTKMNLAWHKEQQQATK